MKSHDDAYIAKNVAILGSPTEFSDIANFFTTLDFIYVWRNHHEEMVDVTLPAARTRTNAETLTKFVYQKPSEEPTGRMASDEEASKEELEMGEFYSPNAFFTSSRKRRASTTFESDISDNG
ncbi:hypothetical protein DFQ28_005642 [Apophysomyces sp. BC1034]|nr:hypothetical protein DFQ30_005667 [Apophysomyces sp. BC1015]KAG0177636.1 hypothetical protein DFQ29_004625 [Apophysomyces sp. BC1021]KAG0187944.1 hypothetical protein DFQ28_005642 [Apophysomyces sp. BC1034]